MTDDVVLIVTLWVDVDRLAQYVEFERAAVRLMRPHGGAIERVVRIDNAKPDAPFEVHVVRFPSRESFAAYRSDPATVELAARRSEVIRRTEVLFGRDVTPYGQSSPDGGFFPPVPSSLPGEYRP